MKIKCVCGGNFEIISQIPENKQVNFKCIECDIYGFIFHGNIFVKCEKDHSYSLYECEYQYELI